MYLTLLKNIIYRLYMYGKYICNSLADCIKDILKPSHNYDPIPKQIIEEEIEEIE